MAKLAKYLPGLGWSVTVLCADVRYPDIHDPGLADEIPEQVQVVRIRPPLAVLADRAAGRVVAAYRSGAPDRFRGSIIRLARAVLVPDRWILWALKAGRIRGEALPTADVVLSSGPPHSGHIAGAHLAARLGVPQVVDLRDAWAEDVFDYRVAPWQGPIDRWLEGRYLPRAKTVVVAVDEYVPRLESRYPSLKGRVMAISNGFDEDDVRVRTDSRDHPRDAEISLLHTGRLVSGQTVGHLFEVLGALTDEGRFRFALSFLGQVDPSHMRSATRSLGRRARAESPVPHRKAIEAMAGADILLVFTGGGGWGDATMTGKLFEYLGVGRPILLIGPRGAAADLVTSTRSGAWAPPEDPWAIRRAIETAVAMARDPTFRGASTEQLAPFTRANLARRWTGVLGAAIATGR
jgi:hypothetical protein